MLQLKIIVLNTICVLQCMRIGFGGVNETKGVELLQ
ncbi:MAG: hypothetical protein K0R98_140 [Rickettsiaceae bacterium]|nr:hypothetical protein [Rickettsiaceae bacterium]